MGGLDRAAAEDAHDPEGVGFKQPSAEFCARGDDVRQLRRVQAFLIQSNITCERAGPPSAAAGPAGTPAVSTAPPVAALSLRNPSSAPRASLRWRGRSSRSP